MPNRVMHVTDWYNSSTVSPNKPALLYSTPTRDIESSLEGLSLSSVQKVNSQSVSQGGVEAHLYTG